MKKINITVADHAADCADFSYILDCLDRSGYGKRRTIICSDYGKQPYPPAGGAHSDESPAGAGGGDGDTGFAGQAYV